MSNKGARDFSWGEVLALLSAKASTELAKGNNSLKRSLVKKALGGEKTPKAEKPKETTAEKAANWLLDI